jgi:hypothetical protein
MNTNTALAVIIACSDSLDQVLGHLAAAIGPRMRRPICRDTQKFTQRLQAGKQHLAVPDNAAASLIQA